MLTKKIFILFIVSFLFCNFTKSQEIIIISKVGNDIVTNIDIENEKKYLLLLNDKLNQLSKRDFSILAKNSLIKEIVKKKEINKSFKIKDEKIGNKIVKNFYTRIGFKNKNEFIEFLDKKKINFENLKEKLIIEAFWKRLIYIKFNNRIKIDEKSIEKDIINYYNSLEKKFEFNLSEIIIDVEKDINIKKKEVFNYIDEFGFKVAANKYSKSDTSKFGGEIGWIKSTRLTKKIKNHISKINIGEITEPIQTSNGYIFIKLNDKREIKEKLDLKSELKQQVEFEKNRQLNQFSLNYFKKLKKNTSIYESK
tara:strand:- start:1165 stop:2091 length:927 start_codon:yes stop_codon:yes gene_type:complete